MGNFNLTACGGCRLPFHTWWSAKLRRPGRVHHHLGGLCADCWKAELLEILDRLTKLRRVLVEDVRDAVGKIKEASQASLSANEELRRGIEFYTGPPAAISGTEPDVKL